jgi:hypothetical protein
MKQKITVKLSVPVGVLKINCTGNRRFLSWKINPVNGMGMPLKTSPCSIELRLT